VSSQIHFSPVHILLQQLHWLPIEYRVNFKIANTTFCTLRSFQPAYLFSTLYAHHSTRSLRLSNINLLSAPSVRTWLDARSFSVAGLKIKNFLPPSSFPNVDLPSYFPPSSKNSTFPAGLPVPLASSFLCLRFSFRWPLCAFINYTYLLTYISAVNEVFDSNRTVGGWPIMPTHWRKTEWVGQCPPRCT